MTADRPLTGFAADLSSEAQSRRAKQNKGRTPWRCGAICGTRKAKQSYAEYSRKAGYKSK